MSRQFRSDDTSKWKEGFGSGIDGNLTISSNTTDSPIDASCTGTTGAFNLSATNASFTPGQCLLIHQTRGTGVGNWELNKILSYSTGTIVLKYPLQNTYTDSGASQAQVIVLKQYLSVTVNAGITWAAKQWNGDVGGILAFLCKGSVTIAGNWSADNAGFIGGTSYNSTGGIQGQGEGTVGAGSNLKTANGNGGGGGRAEYGSQQWSGGGGGGNAAVGGVGAGRNGELNSDGGLAAGNAALTNMALGGGGGGAAKGSSNVNGGRGAGILFTACADFIVSGLLLSRGGNGGGLDGAPTGSGGGGGGSILLKCQNATLGSGLVGLSGGTGGSSSYGTPGGNGSVGRIHLDYSKSYTGSSSHTLDVTLDPKIKPFFRGGAGLLQTINDQ